MLSFQTSKLRLSLGSSRPYLARSMGTGPFLWTSMHAALAQNRLKSVCVHMRSTFLQTGHWNSNQRMVVASELGFECPIMSIVEVVVIVESIIVTDNIPQIVVEAVLGQSLFVNATVF